MKINKINIGKDKLKKICLFVAILTLSNFAFSSSKNSSNSSKELENIINDYYNNIEHDLMIKRDTRNKNRPVNTKSNVHSNTDLKGKLGLNISKRELMIIANQIFKNETGGHIDNLVDWNAGENFPSLGIGHFIWYKSSNGGESLPQMVSFYRSQGIKLPKILEENIGSPWRSRSELLSKKQNGDRDVMELIDFFDRTRETQVLFIYDRLQNSFDKMLNVTGDRENLRRQFYRVANSPNVLYALIDYVNFKGEGISGGSYSNGWGLRQVLENMRGTEMGRSALIEFSESAKYVLERRVNNSRKNERRWLPGWFKRVETYKTFQIR